MERLARGVWSELIAAAWLTEQGYLVFRAVSDHGPIDLVAFKIGEVLLIDVKSASAKIKGKRPGNRINCSPKLKDQQVKMGIIPLYVTRDGDCFFEYQRATERAWSLAVSEHSQRG